ncbi:MAG: hypothetical protein R2838_15250 [Caldilineaceae bacterium]
MQELHGTSAGVGLCVGRVDGGTSCYNKRNCGIFPFKTGFDIYETNDNIILWHRAA